MPNIYLLCHSSTKSNGGDKDCNAQLHCLNNETTCCHDTNGGNPEESQYLSLVSGTTCTNKYSI